MNAETRGPDPDFSSADLLLRRIIREELASRQPVSVLNYDEGPRDLSGLCQILKWCAGVASALAVAGICSGVVMYGNIQGLRAEMAALRKDFDDFRRLVEPKYRGGDDASTP